MQAVMNLMGLPSNPALRKSDQSKRFLIGIGSVLSTITRPFHSCHQISSMGHAAAWNPLKGTD